MHVAPLNSDTKSKHFDIIINLKPILLIKPYVAVYLINILSLHFK